MKEFLEHLIPNYLILQLIIIFGFLLLIALKNRKCLLKEVKTHKIVYLILLAIFITSLFIRIPNISEKKTLYAMDAFYYLIEATQINLENKFSFSCDSPSYPVLLSLFQKAYGYKITLNSAFNSILGSATVILLFVFTLLLFGNRTAAIISSVMVAFDPFHIILSIDGYQSAASIFFTLLSLILLIYSLKTSSWLGFIIVGLSLGFTSQIYYLEIIFLLISLIYVFMQRRLTYTSLKIVSIMLTAFMLSILPFLLIQYKSDDNCGMKRLSDNVNPERDRTNNIICYFANNYCRLYSFSYIYRNPAYQINYLNDDEGHLLSYISFIFFGKGRFALDNFYEFWSPNHKPGNYNLFYIIFSLLLIFCVVKLFYDRVKLKEAALLLIIIFLSIFVFSLYYNVHYKNAESIIIFTFPLISYGAYLMSKIFSKKKIIQAVLIVSIILVIILPFLNENLFTELKSYKKITETNILAIGLKERCTNIYDSVKEYADSCQLMLNNFFEEYNNRINITQVRLPLQKP